MTKPAAFGAVSSEEFVGPFNSWANVKTQYGAVGDGVTDDTQALQKAFDEVGASGKASVIYLPAGTYRITQTISFSNAQPATTGARVYYFAHNLTTNQVTAIMSCINLPASGTCAWDLSGYSPATYRIYAVVVMLGKSNSTPITLPVVTYTTP